MAQYRSHELEYMVEDYDMTDFDDNSFDGDINSPKNCLEDTDSPKNCLEESLDSDFEDDFDLVCLILCHVRSSE